MTNELLSRVFARACDPATIHDNTKYWMAMARIHPQATLEQIAATEVAIGFELPRILKEILMRIGNGGFGPGYGLIGVHGGYADFKGEHLVELGRELGALDRKVLPICNWGCGIYSCLDCAKHEAPVSIFNPQTHALAPENLIRVSITSPAGEVNKVYEREHKSPRPSIKTPKDLSLIPHRLSFEDYISDWADGRSLWAEIEPSLS